MPRFISLNGDLYGVWTDDAGIGKDSVPTALKTTEVNNKIALSQSDQN